MASSFAALLRRLKKSRYPTVQEFADKLGIAPSRLSRAMGARGQSFDIAGCLKLAKVTGESADVVLRAAGKHVVADLLLDCYGQAAITLSDEQQQLLNAYASIRSRPAQLGLLTAIGAMADPHDMNRSMTQHTTGKDTIIGTVVLTDAAVDQPAVPPASGTTTWTPKTLDGEHGRRPTEDQRRGNLRT